MDLSLVKPFPIRKGLESSDWNNHFKVDVLGTRQYLHIGCIIWYQIFCNFCILLLLYVLYIIVYQYLYSLYMSVQHTHWIFYGINDAASKKETVEDFTISRFESSCAAAHFVNTSSNCLFRRTTSFWIFGRSWPRWTCRMQNAPVKILVGGKKHSHFVESNNKFCSNCWEKTCKRHKNYNKYG